MATTQALQLHRQTCVRQAAICDRQAHDARESGDWVGDALLSDYAAMYRKEAIAASMALRVAHRVMQ